MLTALGFGGIETAWISVFGVGGILDMLIIVARFVGEVVRESGA